MKASWYIPVDVEAMAVSPHMHLLGRDMHMSVRFPKRPHPEPDRDRRLGPSLAERLLLSEADLAARRSVVKVVAHFDNSAHPRNPNRPPKLVKVGPNFDDEMCVGYIAVVKKGQDLTVPGSATTCSTSSSPARPDDPQEVDEQTQVR